MNSNTHVTILYLIQAENTPMVKIGITANLQARVRQIQTGCPQRLKVLATWPGSRRLELKLHNLLAQYRRAGEWFELPAFCGLLIYSTIQSHVTGQLPCKPTKTPRVKRPKPSSVKFRALVRKPVNLPSGLISFPPVGDLAIWRMEFNGGYYRWRLRYHPERLAAYGGPLTAEAWEYYQQSKQRRWKQRETPELKAQTEIAAQIIKQVR